jgi:hypothetical protein
LADYFASIYTVNTTAVTEAQGVLLQVNNVSDFSRYAQVLQYLEALTLVESSTLTQIDGAMLHVRVILKSDLERFLSTLEWDKNSFEIWRRNLKVVSLVPRFPWGI